MNFNAPRYCAAAALLFFSAARAAAEEDLVAVLSSGSGAYMEAFSAFQAAYGAGVRYYDASKKKPVITPAARTVVAFGSKAASQDYPSQVNVVYCMAPGYIINPKGREGRTVKIRIIPGFGLILSKFKEIQPSLKRLRVFSMLPEFSADAEELRKLGAARDIQISLVKVLNLDELPGLLRAGLNDMDAFWLPPDPLLISHDSLRILRDFSWGNSIPFYASSKGLAREGAAAAVGMSFAHIGSAAAGAVRAIQAGESPAQFDFPDQAELTLNISAARKCGVEFPVKIMREADYIFP